MNDDAINFGSWQTTNKRPYQEDRIYTDAIPDLTPDQAKQFFAQSARIIGLKTSTHDDSGSTFTGVIVTDKGHIVSAQLGDSFAATITINTENDHKHLERITPRHVPRQHNRIPPHVKFNQFSLGRRPRTHDEILHGEYVMVDDPEDIRRAGGGFGDCKFGDAIRREVELTDHPKKIAFADGQRRRFVMVASDGVKPELIEQRNNMIHTLSKCLAGELKKEPDAPIEKLSRTLVDHCCSQENNGDNISIGLIEMGKGPAVAAVFDGHGEPKAGPEKLGGAKTSDLACGEFKYHIKLLKEKGFFAAMAEMGHIEAAESQIHGKAVQPIVAPPRVSLLGALKQRRDESGGFPPSGQPGAPRR